MHLLPQTDAVIPQSPSAALLPVIMVHGIFRNHRVMGRLGRAFAAEGRRVLAPDLVPNDGSASLNELALQLGEFIERHLPRGEKCDIIGHSMGGMVARSYVQRHGGRRRVRKLVTLASPHHGTAMAWLYPGRGVRDLRPGSTFLRDLARDEHRLEGILVASYWTPFDAIIVPPRSSEVSVGRSECVPLAHHRALVTSRRVARQLVADLR